MEGIGFGELSFSANDSTHWRIMSEATPKFIASVPSTNGSFEVRPAVAGEVPVGNHGQNVQKNANEDRDNFK